MGKSGHSHAGDAERPERGGFGRIWRVRGFPPPSPPLPSTTPRILQGRSWPPHRERGEYGTPAAISTKMITGLATEHVLVQHAVKARLCDRYLSLLLPCSSPSFPTVHLFPETASSCHKVSQPWPPESGPHAHQHPSYTNPDTLKPVTSSFPPAQRFALSPQHLFSSPP